MKIGKKAWLLLAVVVLLSSASAFAQSTPPQSGPSDLLQGYKSAMETQWMQVTFKYANRLFGLLAVIDMAWAMILLVIEGNELQAWMAGFLKKFLTIGFFYCVLINQQTWFPAIVKSFVNIGIEAGGLPGYLNPSDILHTGLVIAANILKATVPNMGAGVVAAALIPGVGEALTAASLIPALIALICALIIVLAYIVITLTFIMATVESYVCMSAGLIFLGFGASRWTVPYTERYFSLVVSTGVRLMVIYMIVGLGNTMSATWIAAAQQLPLSMEGVQALFGLVASVIVYMALAWQVPKLASSLLGGSLQMGSSDLVAPAVSSAVAVGTVGAIAATGGAALAGGGAALAGMLGSGGAASSAAAGAGASTGGSFSAAGSSFTGGGSGAGSAFQSGGGGSMKGVDGAFNSVEPPSASSQPANGSSGVAGAVEPPSLGLGANDASPAQGGNSTTSNGEAGSDVSASGGSSPAAVSGSSDSTVGGTGKAEVAAEPDGSAGDGASDSAGDGTGSSMSPKRGPVAVSGQNRAFGSVGRSSASGSGSQDAPALVESAVEGSGLATSAADSTFAAGSENAGAAGDDGSSVVPAAPSSGNSETSVPSPQPGTTLAGGGVSGQVEGNSVAAASAGGAGDGGSSVATSASSSGSSEASVTSPQAGGESSAASGKSEEKSVAPSRSSEASGSGQAPAPPPSTDAPRGRSRREVMGMVSRGELSAEEGEAQLEALEGKREGGGLGEKINSLHNTAANVREHLPEDSAHISAPNLNIQHGE